MKTATADYRLESDAVGQFFDAHLVFDATGRVARKELRETYEGWCEEQGAEPLGARRFAERLRARGARDCPVRNRTRVENGWRGVRLVTAEEHVMRFDAVGTVGIVSTKAPVPAAANDTAAHALCVREVVAFADRVIA